MFHVLVLKHYVGGSPGCISPLPPLTDEKWHVIQPEFVLQSRTVLHQSKPIKQLLIYWLGLPISECSWEDLSLLARQISTPVCEP